MSAARTATSPDASAFGESRAGFEEIVGWLEGADTASLTHGELEDDLDRRDRHLLLRLLQDHLDLRARQEQRADVVDSGGVRHGSVEAGHCRTLATIFGEVTVERLAYRHRGTANLHPADASLNLPAERHSHGLGRLAAIESTRGSFDDAVEAINRGTGVSVPKRQAEQLTSRAASDIEDFYATRQHAPAQEGVGSGPWYLALDQATSTVYVGNLTGNTLSLIDSATCNAVVTAGCDRVPPTVAVEGLPTGVAVDAQTGLVYVTSGWDSDVATINAASCNATNTQRCTVSPYPLRLGGFPTDPVLDGAVGTVYVPDNGDGEVSLVGLPAWG
jgi:hypothetical protein